MKLCEQCGIHEVEMLKGNKEGRFCSRKCRCIHNAKVNSTKGRKVPKEIIDKIVATKKANGTYDEHSKKLKKVFSEKDEKFWVDRKEKTKQTNLERYGVEWSSQSPEMFINQVRYKQFMLPSGKVINTQGYECIVIDSLLETYNEDDLLISCIETPTIDYVHENVKKRFYPDIYIKSENKLIEVKSTYTFELHKEMNEVKKKAALDNGYNFEFVIIDNPGKNMLKN